MTFCPNRAHASIDLLSSGACAIMPQRSVVRPVAYAPGPREQLLLARLAYDLYNGSIERAGLKGDQSAAARVCDESAGTRILVLSVMTLTDFARAHRIDMCVGGCPLFKIRANDVFFSLQSTTCPQHKSPLQRCLKLPKQTLHKRLCRCVSEIGGAKCDTLRE